jgi:DNA-binding GntR family transcriptional regulator
VVDNRPVGAVCATLATRVFPPATRLIFRNQVIDALRAAIVDGRLQPGQPITERQLAHDLQISRAPIREALRDLEKEGLIVTRPHKGTYVASFSDEDVQEIYTLRANLETMALGRAIERATAADIQALNALIDDMERHAQTDFTQMINVDLTFHRRICEIAAHRRLLDAWDVLANQLRALYTITDVPTLIRSLYGYVDQMGARHRPIVEAIRRRDGPGGQRYIAAHVGDVASTIVEQRAEVAARTTFDAKH